jgi:hypothetical protein
VSRKRRPTPTSNTNLRRSKRTKVVNDGFKSMSPAVTRGKSAVRKKVVGTISKGGQGSVQDPLPPLEVTQELLLSDAASSQD